MRVIFYVLLSFFIVGCASKSAVDNYEVVESFEDENLTYEIDKNWYKSYNQTELNTLVDRALVYNSDLKISALNIAQAYARAGLIEADLLPTFSSGFGGSVSRDISKNDSSWKENYNANISASYELDIFAKLRNSASQADWEANASVFDLESLRLSVINSVVDGYFKELFINDTLKLLDENLQNYKKLQAITRAKFELGKDTLVNLLEFDKSIISLKSRILSFQKDRLTNEELLKNLLHLKPNDELNFAKMTLDEVTLLGVDLNIPYYALGNRPDLRALISRINSSFYGYKVNQKAFYPTVTIGASLSSSEEKFSDVFGLDLLSGNVKINLPFLDYTRLKQRVKISEIEFEKRVLEYEKALNSALNELNLHYKEYEISLFSLQNYQNIVDNSNKLSSLYLTKYEQGSSELKDYLDAKNSEISAKINFIQEKYKALNSEILVYKSMAGKFKTR
ncbi:TolC family protein [Campylobacter geochelonis]|uniref:Outer membrane efflux protein n=1 Tax=Campylobacter geochelonis TaxID=1780362 RepID=A0A128EKF0_9BACT|nr:TolC family protein [Campylobacter geochelonis]QKF71197.1 outer membrane efflux protein, TolC family [Campylobacter geochelonis]CZE48818.1 outer membrane efflux protein [Campylobacter geochelonis]